MKKYSLMPSCCLLCDLNGCKKGLGVCKRCVSQLQELLEDRCIICGKTPLNCKCENPSGANFLFFYRSRGSKFVIHSLKNSGDPGAATFLCELLLSGCGVDGAAFDAVTFVPRSRSGKLKYGYDQAELLAKCISELLGLPFVRVLKAKREGQQKLLTASERRVRMKNRYSVSESFLKLDKPPKKLLLTDDVCTTGQTLNACIGVIKKELRLNITPIVAAMTNNKTNLFFWGTKK